MATHLEIWKRLAEINPQTYEPSLAMTQNNLGLLYSDKKFFTWSETAYLEALHIYQRLAKTNPRTYEPNLATTQNNLGTLYGIENDLGILYGDKKFFTKSETAYLEALHIYQRLAKTNPQTYEPDLAMTQNNLGYLYFRAKNFGQAEAFLVESFLIREKLINQYTDVYSPVASATAVSLLDVYIALRNKISTELDRALLPATWEAVNDKLYNLAKQNKDVAAKYSLYCGNYSWYALLARKFKESELTALKVYDVDNSQVWVKINLAHALLLQNRYAEALQVYKELKPLKDEEGKSYVAICLEDLEALEKGGVTHKDISKIRQFLRQ